MYLKGVQIANFFSCSGALLWLADTKDILALIMIITAIVLNIKNIFKKQK